MKKGRLTAGKTGPLAVSSLSAVQALMKQRVGEGTVEQPALEPLTAEQHRAIAAAEPASGGLVVESLLTDPEAERLR